MILRPGAKLNLLYMVAAYVVPGSLVMVAGTPSLYREVPINIGALCMLLLAILTYLVLGNLPLKEPEQTVPVYEFRFIRTHWQIAILARLTATAAFGFATGVNRLRYSVEAIAERNSPLALLYAAVPAILHFFLLIYIFYDRQFPTRNGIGDYLKKALLLAGLFLSANGIATMLLAALAAVFVFFPNTFRGFLFRPQASASISLMTRLKRFVRISLLVGLLAGAGAAAWIFGEATKRGQIESVIDLVTSPGIIEWFLDWTNLRLSPSYISLISALDHHTLGTSWLAFTDNFLAPIRSFLFRINYILMSPFDIARPDAAGISVINYMMIEVSPTNMRSGTAPGLLAGFLYAFPFPLNLTVLVAYLLFAQRFVGPLILAIPGKLTLAGWIIFLNFALPIFADPIDLLLIVDDGVIAFALLVVLRQVLIRRQFTCDRLPV
jgi:hypothetical protein